MNRESAGITRAEAQRRPGETIEAGFTGQAERQRVFVFFLASLRLSARKE